MWLNRGKNTFTLGMADDRVILLTNRGDGVDEIPNDENNDGDDFVLPG